MSDVIDEKSILKSNFWSQRIKAGQIYKQGNGEKLVITNIKDNFVSVVYQDGYAVTYDTNLLNNGFVFNYLIFEFPDWREAVNSKELLK